MTTRDKAFLGRNLAGATLDNLTTDAIVILDAENRMAGVFTLAGLDHRLAVEGRSVVSCPLRTSAMRTVWNLILELLAVVLLAATTTALLLDRAILYPLRCLSDEVSRSAGGGTSATG
jgi:hypothetical protein